MRDLKVFLAFGLLGLSGQAQAAAPSELEIATALLTQGKPAEAMAKVDTIIAQAMTKEAKAPDAICPGVAVAYLQNFMQKSSLGVQISVENDWCEAMLVKGYALTELKRPIEAEQVLGALVRHDPLNPQYNIEYAFSIRSNGQPERALSLYQKAEALAARSSDKNYASHWRAAALRGQGYTYIDLQRWDDADKAYRKSLKLEPNSPIAQNELNYVEEHRPR